MKGIWALKSWWALVILLAPISARSDSLDRLFLESVEFKQTDLAMALDFLASKAGESSPGKTPINIVLIDPDGTLAKLPISLKLSRVPWNEALRYTCELGSVIWRWDDAVLVVGAKKDVERLALQRSKILAGPGSETNAKRLNAAVIEQVNFKGATLDEVADFLRQLGQTLQPGAAGGKGLPFNVLIKENAANPVSTRTISLTMHRISMADLLHYSTGLAGCRYRVDARTVVIGEAEDLARAPGGPRNPSGPIFDLLAAKTLESIEIPVGTSAAEFIEVMRELGGVNGLSMAPDAVTASRMTLHQVTTLEMLRYFNEASGTAYRLDPTAVVITNDPAVKVRPKPPVIPKPTSSGPAGLGFDP